MGYLSIAQLGELNRAYGDEGVQELQTEQKVAYYDRVSYEVVGMAEEDQERNGVGLPEGNNAVVRVVVRVGEVIEFRAPFEADGRGFAEVVAIMQHCNTVFLVVAWMVRTPTDHTLLRLPQYRRIPLFGEFRSAFFSLSLVDHPRFVGGTHFVAMRGDTWVRNDWVFNAV